MKKSTNKELIIELGRLSDTSLRTRLIGEARNNEFHDYKSHQVCGKMHFISCANWFKNNLHKVTTLENVVKDVAIMEQIELDIKEGVYDEGMDEEDKAQLRQDIIENTSNEKEAQALTRILNL